MKEKHKKILRLFFFGNYLNTKIHQEDFFNLAYSYAGVLAFSTFLVVQRIINC
jgi:hypothetical protein